MSEARKGKRPKNFDYLLRLNRARSEDWRKRISESKKGSKHWNWKGGITKLRVKLWHTFEYHQWRSNIFLRDNYICRLCGMRGGSVEADHYPKTFSEILKQYKILTLEDAFSCGELWDVNNGRTLCKPCHKKYGINPRNKK